MLIFSLLWLSLGFYVAILAKQRGRSFIGWLAFSLLASPLIAGLVLISRPDLAEKDFVESVTQDLEFTHVKCTSCGEYVKPDATKCRYCNATLTPQIDAVEKRIQAKINEGLDDIKATQATTITMVFGLIGGVAIIAILWFLF